MQATIINQISALITLVATLKSTSFYDANYNKLTAKLPQSLLNTHSNKVQYLLFCISQLSDNAYDTFDELELSLRKLYDYVETTTINHIILDNFNLKLISNDASSLDILNIVHSNLIDLERVISSIDILTEDIDDATGHTCALLKNDINLVNQSLANHKLQIDDIDELINEL